jgi:beta-lactamase superfamily II metal-dependent hydrolase
VTGMAGKTKGWWILPVALSLLLVTSCVVSTQPPPPLQPPVVQDFSVNPSEITAGQSATLSWDVTDAISIVIEPNIGSVPAAANKVISPDVTTTYTLVAANAGGSVSRSVTVIVIPPKAQLKVHFIDVGQGDSILIDSGDTEVLIDGGDKLPGVVVYLGDFVDGALEVMVATHPHADHIGGLIRVLDAFEVDEVWLNRETSTSDTYSQFMSAVNSEGAQVYEARRGDTIQVSDLTFNVLHPVNLSDTTNNNSIVLSLSYGQVDFLFTGDAEQEAEASMLAKGIVPDVEVLKVGHHGSGTASSIQFLQVAKPECAIYMAGKENSYGHPHQETIDALCGVDAKIYGTDIHGTIIITTDGMTYNVHPLNNVPPVVCPNSNDTTHDLTVNINGQGTTNPSLDTHKYNDGTQVTITASPASGWKFDHWGGDASGTSPTIVITMDSNKNVTAYFKQEACLGSNVQITYIFYDGLVYRTESDEYVEITNLGDTSQDLEGWVLKDISEGNPSFTFPSYVLAPGAKIRVYTNEIHPEWGGFSFRYGKAIWNNSDPDVAALYNAQVEEVSRKSY